MSSIAAILRQTDFPPERLTLEITESVSLEHSQATSETMLALRDLGVRLAIDDFGTGHSGLNVLRRRPIQSLKIDRSLVTNLPSVPDDQAIVQAIVTFAQILGLQTVAEGIETLRAAGPTPPPRLHLRPGAPVLQAAPRRPDRGPAPLGAFLATGGSGQRTDADCVVAASRNPHRVERPAVNSGFPSPRPALSSGLWAGVEQRGHGDLVRTRFLVHRMTGARTSSPHRRTWPSSK